MMMIWYLIICMFSVPAHCFPGWHSCVKTLHAFLHYCSAGMCVYMLMSFRSRMLEITSLICPQWSEVKAGEESNRLFPHSSDRCSTVSFLLQRSHCLSFVFTQHQNLLMGPWNFLMTNISYAQIIGNVMRMESWQTDSHRDSLHSSGTFLQTDF